MPTIYDRVLTRIMKTGFMEKVGVKIEKLEFDLEKLEFLVSAEIRSFIYGWYVFYPAKWQFKNPCED